MKDIWMTIGISGCGKSTWAKQFAQDEFVNNKRLLVPIERDELRKTILAQQRKLPYEQDLNWSLWDWDWEYRVNLLQEQMFRSLLTHNAVSGIIISDTNISQGGRNKLVKKLVDEFGIASGNIMYKVFDVDPAVAIARDLQRKYPVGERVILDQHDKLSMQKF